MVTFAVFMRAMHRGVSAVGIITLVTFVQRLGVGGLVHCWGRCGCWVRCGSSVGEGASRGRGGFQAGWGGLRAGTWRGRGAAWLEPAEAGGLSHPVWVAAVACHLVCGREDARRGGLAKPPQHDRVQRAPTTVLEQPGQAVLGGGHQEEGAAGGRGEGEDGTPPPRVQTAEPRGNIFHPPEQKLTFPSPSSPQTDLHVSLMFARQCLWCGGDLIIIIMQLNANSLARDCSHPKTIYLCLLLSKFLTKKCKNIADTGLLQQEYNICGWFSQNNGWHLVSTLGWLVKNSLPSKLAFKFWPLSCLQD